MKVELLRYTTNALDLLLRTKNTRLAHGDDPVNWKYEKKLEHLAYMLDTIKSSWEFVDYTFNITGVSRAFTHQLVRTRTGAYAQESQRTVDVRDHNVVTPVFEDLTMEKEWHEAVAEVFRVYGQLIDHGVPVQDARGLLPIAVTTSIEAKFSLRTLSEMARVRLCVRTQGEYQDVFRAMREEVLKVHSWAEDFIQVQCVAEGVCAFPRYGRTQCPVWHESLDREAAKAAQKVHFWSSERHVAIPVAKEGRTM